MNEEPKSLLQIVSGVSFDDATLVLAFSGWMDGGDVSTGTVRRLVDLLEAQQVARIDPEPFYICNMPGPMEIAALFRPHIHVKDGLIQEFDMPSNSFYCHPAGKLFLFIGKEPNMRWRTFGECVLRFARQTGVRNILFVGSFGGSVPHTRQPRLYVACSDPELLGQMERYGLRRTNYEGPGSFTTYLMMESSAAGFEMASIVAEIPGYLQGTNLMSIEAVTRRLAKVLQLPLELDSLRNASTQWELEISQAVEDSQELADTVRRLEDAYDDELLAHEED